MAAPGRMTFPVENTTRPRAWKAFCLRTEEDGGGPPGRGGLGAGKAEQGKDQNQ